MSRVTVYENGNKHVIECESGEKLSVLLMKNGIQAEHPCGGNGRCGKCRVTVDGESRLSCKYIVEKDITVLIDHRDSILSPTGLTEEESSSYKTSLALDIGTTTVALALVSPDDKKVIRTLTADNPQRVYGADVMSRLDFCRKNGVTQLHKLIIGCVNSMIENICEKSSPDTLYVTGNTAMLHIFFGVDCSEMAVSPYIPSFLASRSISAEEISISSVKKIVSIPCISSFVGADIVSGLNFAEMPCKGKYNILIDLGTNAEIVLYAEDRLFCTAAAAGPCFEGANISCGMSAVNGAVCSYIYGEKPVTVGNAPVKGICASGLVDVIAELLEGGIIDSSGYMENEKFVIDGDVYLLRADIRNFQLAKSAVYSAVATLIKKAGITFRDVDTCYISGGFASSLNIKNAVSTGLLPVELALRCKCIGNSALAGTVKYICEKNDLSVFTENALYEDLSQNSFFRELFIKNINFNLFE